MNKTREQNFHWILDNVDFVNDNIITRNFPEKKKWCLSGVNVYLGEYEGYIEYIKDELKDAEIDFSNMTEEEMIETARENCEAAICFYTVDELIDFVDDTVDFDGVYDETEKANNFIKNYSFVA